MQIIRKIGLSLCGIVLSSLTYADGILYDPMQSTAWQPVIGLGGGISLSSTMGKSQYFPATTPGSSQFYQYTNQDETQSKGLFEVFLGAEHTLYSHWRLQPGIAYSQAGTYVVSGTLTQGLDPQSSNQFAYQYKVTTRQLLAQAKLMRPYKQRYYPYFLLGLGGSFNSAFSYSTNIPAQLISTQEYANKTSRSFAYRVGLGLDVDVLSHTRLGIAYRFSGLGAVGLGGGHIGGVSVPGSLTQSQMYANEVLAQLTYLI